MKKLLTATLLLTSTMAMAQTREDYDKAVEKFKTFYNRQQGDSIYNMLSDRSKTLLPLDKTIATFKTTYNQIGKMNEYEFSSEKDNFSLYKTTFERATLTLVMSLDKENKLETFRFLPYKAERSAPEKESANDILLKTPAVDIHGTYTIPEAAGPVPVVLIIAGSGPTDRDGNNSTGLQTDCYKKIADSLKNAGIACLRYDKRGAGSSVSAAMKEQDGMFEDLVSDAAGLVKLLLEDKRFSKVYVLGHSEGSLVAILVAERQPIAGVISVAGAGDRIDKIILKQVAEWPNDGQARSKVILDSVQEGYTVTDVPEDLLKLFRPSVQPFLRTWMKYEPREEIKRIKQPVLILQGTTDKQVGTDQAEKLHKANRSSQLVEVEGMNHVLKNAPDDAAKNSATYFDPKLPLCPGFMAPIVSFIKSTSAR